MIRSVLSRIKNKIRPTKQYTLEEWSEKQMADLRQVGNYW